MRELWTGCKRKVRLGGMEQNHQGKIRWQEENPSGRLLPNMRNLFCLCVAFLAGGRAALAATGEVTFTSGPAQVALIELYTSEGCSSCPPAETWLSALRDQPGLWKDFVPVAFHVTYWDNLGWVDPFSADAATRRQYALAGAWGSGSVYTPCFVRNGREWHPEGKLNESTGPAGTLTLTRRENGNWLAQYQLLTPTKTAFEVHVALLGGNISSAVKAGENAGRQLAHDFVMLALQSAPLPAAGAELKVADAKLAAGSRRAVAAWVTRAGELAPLQATGGWLP